MSPAAWMSREGGWLSGGHSWMVLLPLASAGLDDFLLIFHCGEAEVALVSRTISSCLSVCLSLLTEIVLRTVPSSVIASCHI